MPIPKDFYIFLSEKPLSKTSEDAYTWMMRELMAWVDDQDGLTLKTLTAKEVKDFIAYRVWGNSMQRILNIVLSQYLTWKHQDKHQLTRWKVKREIAPPQRTLTRKQVQKLLDSFQPGISQGNKLPMRKFWMTDLARPQGKRNFALIWFLLDTGFRSAEVCSLQLQHLDLEERTAKAKVKGGKWRTASFTEQTAQALADWLAVRDKLCTDKSKDYVFLTVFRQHRGKPLTHNGLRVLCRRLGQYIGIGKLSPHDFRRTFATMAARDGASLQSIQQAGGWSSIEMVMRYTAAIRGSEIIPHLPGNQLHHNLEESQS